MGVVRVKLCMLVTLILLTLMIMGGAVIVVPRDRAEVVRQLNHCCTALGPNVGVVVPFVSRTGAVITVHEKDCACADDVSLHRRICSFSHRGIVAGSGVRVRVGTLLCFRVMSPFGDICRVGGLPGTVRGLARAALHGVVNRVRLSRALASHSAVGAGLHTILSSTAGG